MARIMLDDPEPVTKCEIMRVDIFVEIFIACQQSASYSRMIRDLAVMKQSRLVLYSSGNLGCLFVVLETAIKANTLNCRYNNSFCHWYGVKSCQQGHRHASGSCPDKTVTQSSGVNSENGQSSCSSGCREIIRAHCFGDKGADTDSVSAAKAAQFHSRSRNVFSSVSVMVHLMFLCCGFCDRRMPVIILLCENKTDCISIRLVRFPAHKPVSSNYHHPELRRTLIL